MYKISQKYRVYVFISLANSEIIGQIQSEYIPHATPQMSQFNFRSCKSVYDIRYHWKF